MKRGTPHAPFNLLLVEDNPGDADLIQEALAGTPPDHRVFVARDGVEAVAFLHKQAEFASVPTPDLVLLDLNLPRKDGREVLEDIKGDPSLRHIPIVVVTSSEAERDLLEAYQLHANCFVTKPVDLDELFSTVRALKQFWLGVARLPPPR